MVELSPTAAGAHSAPSEPLLERDGVVGVIDDALRRVAQGTGTAIFLVGMPGMGKTSLINLAEARAQAAGFRVAGAVGSEREMELPFGLVSQAIVALGGSDVEDVVVLERLGGQPARFYRTFRWLATMAAESPLVLALDDLHWADRDSLDLLGFICRRLAGLPILVLGSLRPEPSSSYELSADLASSGHARLLSLEPLSREGSETLLRRACSRGLDAEELDRICIACAGTPLLVELAAWSVEHSGSLPAEADDERGFVAPVRMGVSAGPAGALAGRLLLERFVGQGADSLAYVRAASVFGVRFRPSHAGTLAGLSDEVTVAVHMRLTSAGLLADLGGDRARFIHPLFAQVLLASRPASEREQLHIAAFRLLTAEGAPDAVAAEHAVAAGMVGDQLAIEVTARAGRTALAQGALDAACTHFANAVELAAEAADEVLLLSYASALAARGRIGDAETVCAGLLRREGLAPETGARTLALLASIAFFAGRPAEAEQLYEDAVAAAALVDRATEGSMLLDAVLARTTRTPAPSVLRLTTRALAILPADDPSRRPAEFMHAFTKLMLGDPSGTALLERETERFMQQAPGEDPGWGWTLTVQAVNMLKLTENFECAKSLFEREYAHATEEGAPILIGSLAVAYADAMYRLGLPHDGLELVQQAIELTGMSMGPWTDIAQSVLLNELGRDEQAHPHIETLRAFRAASKPEYAAIASLWLDVFDATRLLSAGEPQSASATMLDAAETASRSGFRHPCIVPWAGVAIEAHVAAEAIDRARTLIEDLEELSRPLTCRWPAAQVAVGHARLAAAEGRREEADSSFARALSILAELPMPLAQAEVLLAWGAHLRRSGRPREAREPIALALSQAEEAGAERLARPARAELAAAGGRRRRRNEDPNKLTSQEERVAALAADGMTNAQIGSVLCLSPKTVGHHLQHIYEKLDIDSRRDLIAGRHKQPRADRVG